MKVVTMEVASREIVNRRAVAAFKSSRQGAFISFATPELLWKVLTEKRWEILKALAGRGAMGLREIARLIKRDVKAVHADVHALLNAGVLRKNKDGKIEFPFDAVCVNFMLKAA